MSSSDMSIDMSINSSINSSIENLSDTSSENDGDFEPDLISVSSENMNDPLSEIVVLANYIRERFETSNTYIFRCVKIDGIYCCCVVYRDEKIINVESVRVIVKNDKGTMENYSLHFDYYDTIENAIEIVKKIVTTYKLYNGDLYSPEDYIHLVAEECIIPYSEEQRCSVCNINTTDMTNCGHYICFRCREQLLFLEARNCPHCNKLNVLNVYHNDANIINNFHYMDLVEAIKSEQMDYVEEEPEEYIPAEQLIAQQIHSFIVNNPGFIDAIVKFIEIFNRFVGNP